MASAGSAGSGWREHAPHFLRGAARSSAQAMFAPAMVLVLIVAAWELVPRFLGIPTFIFPPPSSVIERAFADSDLIFSRHAPVTFKTIGLGFILAYVVSMTLSISIAHSSPLRRGFYPLIIGMQTIPIITVAPIFIIWFGYTITPRILITALIAFFPLTVNTISGFQAVERDLINLLRSLGASKIQIFFKLSVPTALPYMFSGLRISVTLCVIGAAVSEWTGGGVGLGYLILHDTQRFQTARAFASIGILALTGIILFVLVVLLEWLLMPWRHRTVKPRRKLASRRRSDIDVDSEEWSSASRERVRAMQVTGSAWEPATWDGGTMDDGGEGDT